MNAVLAACLLPAAFCCKRCIWRQDLGKGTELLRCYPLMLIIGGFNQILKRIQRFHHMGYSGVVFERCRVLCDLLT
jgi:hypothetical protein